MAEYTLPDLPYDYGALAPHIAGEIMELHHSKHHQTYVTALNDTLEKLAEARENGDFGAIVGLEKTLAFNLGGHVNHSIFWKNLSPDGGDKPTGELAAAIDEHFGSFDAFQAHFTAAATTIQGSGWADPRLGPARQAPARPPALRPAGQPPRRARSRSSCSTCGSTRSTCSTRT